MKIVFMGTPPAAAVSLSRLLSDGHEVAAVYTQPDRPSGRGNKVVFSAVKELALENSLPVRQPLKIKTPEALEAFKSHAADVTVVVAYGRILPVGFLEAFKYGAVNLHFSLLPKYRGAAPVNWAIVNGETSTGVTTIKMDAGLDTGDILLACETPIGTDETAVELMSRLGGIGADVLSETLQTIDLIEPKPQNDSEATFAPIMSREDGLVDWSVPAAQIVDRVRGFQPFPGTFGFCNGKRIVIWRASADESAQTEAHEPGAIAAISNGSIFVAAGGGSVLRIEEIQIEGKRRMPVGDILNGKMFNVGDKFTRYV